MNEFEQQYNIPQNNVPEFTPLPSPKKEKPKAGKIIALALCFSLIGGALGTGATLYFLKDNPTKKEDLGTVHVQVSQREEVVLDEVEADEVMTAAQVYAQNVNSTVGITTSITTNYWGYQTTSAASGSGFIISEDGYILTNYHVIQDSNAITVSLYDNTSYNATLVGYDSSNDIAVLKVDAEGLTPVVIGDNETMHVGDTVIAIGNPLGELTFSLTQGVISAKGRRVTFSNGSTMELLQTDCSINSGNSGGALFNLYGEVIGITNAKYSNNGSTAEATIESIGFAIPIGDVMPLVESIIEKGYVSKAFIGVSVVDVSEESQNYGLPKGAAVKEVTANGPAEKAGLQINDIITSVNGTEITGSEDLIAVIGKAAVGDVLDVEIYRKGETLHLSIEVGEQTQPAIQQEPITNNPWLP